MKKVLDQAGRPRVDLNERKQVFGAPGRVELSFTSTSTRICNASSRAPLKLEKAHVREGGNDHLRHKSRGW